MQLYADGIIIQAKTIEELGDIYHNLKTELGKIGLTINTEKCLIISDDPMDTIKDNYNGQIIISQKKGKYLGQIINSNGVTENIIEQKMFGKLIKQLNAYDGFSKSSKIRIFKTYLISKINHLLPLISLTGNIDICWKSIRNIIFNKILNRCTLPLETALAMGVGYYNIIIRPLIKMIERYNNYRSNNEELKFIKEAATKAILFWLNTEKKHPDAEKETLQKIASNELWLDSKQLDALLYNNLSERIMRNNNKTLNIKNIKILKFPNVNYYLSNAPYHEIIDTAIIRDEMNSDKEKDIKFKRMVSLTEQLIIGTEIALILQDPINSHKIMPDFSKDKDIIEEMIITESLIEQEILYKKEKDEQIATELIKELIMTIPKKIKENKNKNTQVIEFKKIRDIQDQYRNITSNMNPKQARCLDIAHELIEKINSENHKIINPKRGRPNKIKIDNHTNNRNITDYFIKKD